MLLRGTCAEFGSVLRGLDVLDPVRAACVAPALVRRRRRVAAPWWLSAFAGSGVQGLRLFAGCHTCMEWVLGAASPGAVGPSVQAFRFIAGYHSCTEWYLALPFQGAAGPIGILFVATLGWLEGILPFGLTQYATTVWGGSLLNWAVSAILLLLGWIYTSLKVS